MNIQQAKALFFAQYLGRTVITPDDDGRAIETNRWFVNHKYEILFMDYLFDQEDPMYLLLRSVNQLTDEECEIIATILGLKPNEYFCKNFSNGFDRKEWVLNFFINFSTESTFLGKSQNLHIVLQLLIRLGILLPFTYLDENNKPITLQPDEIIALGWCKIK